jgi:hypothetical protein
MSPGTDSRALLLFNIPRKGALSRRRRSIQDLGERGERSTWNTSQLWNFSTGELTVKTLLWAVTGDVTALLASVAGLASGAQWSTVWSSTISAYIESAQHLGWGFDILTQVTVLSAGVALDSLSLAVSGEVVDLTALVAGKRTWATSETTTWSKSTVSTAWSETTTTSTWNWTSTGWSWAVACEMAGQTARVASATGTGTAKTESWAVGCKKVRLDSCKVSSSGFLP